MNILRIIANSQNKVNVRLTRFAEIKNTFLQAQACFVLQFLKISGFFADKTDCFRQRLDQNGRKASKMVQIYLKLVFIWKSSWSVHFCIMMSAFPHPGFWLGLFGFFICFSLLNVKNEKGRDKRDQLKPHRIILSRCVLSKKGSRLFCEYYYFMIIRL